MTERPLSITTQIATPIQAAFNSTASIPASDARPVIESADEEPYTIKCICDYFDDDGNTIYCETCDTWQHIECFYPGRVDDASKEEFDHSCADCKPRGLGLDGRAATERQRQQRHNKSINDSPDKKTKRPPTKSHKKKSKPSDLQVNGHHDHDGHKHSGSPPPPHTKKSKGHRSNQSISSKRSPPLNHARPHSHNHPPSPAHTPPDLPRNFQVHSYSERFLTLYDDDRSITLTSTNSFANLSVSNDMALWLRDPEKLQKDVGKKRDDVFDFLTVDVNSLKWPILRVERTESIFEGDTIRWRSLTNSNNLPEPGRIVELNGVVGFQKDYSADIENRWSEIAHPRPFVFFHPLLPLFIDTRTEGSLCRYARRSCRPNTSLGTFIAQGSEYHFWLTTDRPLAAMEQITIPWDFRFASEPNSHNRYLGLLNLSDEDGIQAAGGDITDDEYDHLTQIIYAVLSDHGGCACNLGPDCAFARFHRNYQGRSQVQTNGIKSKKGRKPKQSHVSPTSTGHATNSRAASEGQGDQYEDEDNRSISGSIRSKPHSRDLTPSHNSEPNGIATENSEREKRKLAALEDTFRKMEQGQPPRKKKRASDGSNMSVPSHSAAAQSTPKPRQRSVAPRASISHAAGSAANGSRSRQYVDASTASRRQSGSPYSAISTTGAQRSPDNHVSPTHSIAYRSRHSSVNPKPTYTDSCTQTDEVENAWWNEPTPKPKRSIVPLSKRLLKNRHNIQKKQEAQASQRPASRNGGENNSVRASPTVSMDLDPLNHDERYNTESPTDIKGRNMSITSSTPSVDTSVDIAMLDTPVISSGHTIKPPPPWPSQSNPTASSNPPQKSPDLRVQMPAAPIFSTPNMSAAPSATGTLTPSSASSTAQSPFGGTGSFPNGFPAPIVNGIAPSPVRTERKKLSLSDYKAARAKKTDTSNANKATSGSSPTVAPAVLKPSLSTIDEAKAHGGLEGSALVESPAVEKVVNPLAVAGPTSGPLPNNTTPSEKV